MAMSHHIHAIYDKSVSIMTSAPYKPLYETSLFSQQTTRKIMSHLVRFYAISY